MSLAGKIILQRSTRLKKLKKNHILMNPLRLQLARLRINYMCKSCAYDSETTRKCSSTTQDLCTAHNSAHSIQGIKATILAHISCAVIRQLCTQKLSQITDKILSLYPVSTGPIIRSYSITPNKFSINKHRLRLMKNSADMFLERNA